jgi:CDP-diacylglycerol--glycerol-3-phosphate 3-phosphatidyltransferase
VSIYELKPQFQLLLRPTVRHLHEAGVTANQVTVAACLASVALGAVLTIVPERNRLFLFLPVWLFLRMSANAIDGMLAREFGQASTLGAYLNDLADAISDTALYLPFAFVAGSNPWFVGTLIVLALLSEMAGVLGVTVGAGRRYEGPMGKSDRAFVFGLLGLLVGLSAPIDALLNGIWIALALLIAISMVNRIRAGVAERSLL